MRQLLNLDRQLRWKSKQGYCADLSAFKEGWLNGDSETGPPSW